MWIARDKNGSLHIFLEKPIKKDNEWVVVTKIQRKIAFVIDNCMFKVVILKDKCFPSVVWEDEEPRFIRFINKAWIKQNN